MEKDNTIERLRSSLSELSSIMYKIYVEWWVSEKPVTKSAHIAQNMYRMMIFKAMSICQMSEGIIVIPTQKGIIPDPSTMYPILRSMYELLFLFKCMLVSPKNEKERDILINLWKIKGNNNLTLISDEIMNEDSTNRRKSASEENDIARHEIRERMTEITLPRCVINSIERIIDPNKTSPTLKAFMFKYSEPNNTITGFSELHFSDKEMGTELSDDNYIYSHYSAHSHPSYLGVKEFEEMYHNSEEGTYVQEILQHTCKYLHCFMKEFCKYNASYRLYYAQRECEINEHLKI